jgi:hypothetical protein
MLVPYLESILKSDIEKINDLLENPPEIFLIHVYSADKIEGKFIPNYEGLMQIDGFLALFKSIRAKNPLYSPTVLFAGSLETLFEGNRLSTIYSNYLSKKSSEINIIDEANINTGISIRETRGEVMFLKYILIQNNILNSTPILDIALLAHTERVKVLLKANGINAQVISSEALVQYFDNEIWTKLVENDDFIENINKFYRGDSKKLMIMNLMGDQKGKLFEYMMKFITPRYRAIMVRTAERKLSSYFKKPSN